MKINHYYKIKIVYQSKQHSIDRSAPMWDHIPWLILLGVGTSAIQRMVIIGSKEEYTLNEGYAVIEHMNIRL